MKAEIINPTNELFRPVDKILRVCAYCRVSTASKDQLHSYHAQLEYYKRLSLDHTNWLLMDIYADEGISGRSTKNREQFNQMIEDANYGMYDMIICKSISRFTRDIVDALEICRHLKAKSIDVFFERENIHTLFLDSEQYFTYQAVYAQGESENISRNVRWSQHKKMESGDWLPVETPYGYRIKNGDIIKDQNEQKVIDYMFDAYINGFTAKQIADELNKRGYRTRKGNTWHSSTILGILNNPIYAGELVAQKTFIETTAPYKKRVNHGEMEKYHYLENHDAYIDNDKKEKLLNILEFRRNQKNIQKDTGKYHNKYAISKNIHCQECGATLKRIKVKKNKNEIYFAYACQNHRKDKNSCSFIAFKEKGIQDAFMRMVNKLITHDSILTHYAQDLRLIEREANQEEVKVVLALLDEKYKQAELARARYQENIYDKAFYDEIMTMIFDHTIQLRREYRELKNKYDLQAEIQNSHYLLELLKHCEPDYLFNEKLYEIVIQEAIALDKNTIKFILINGFEIEEKVNQ